MTILTRFEMAGRSVARKYFFPRESTPILDFDPYDDAARERRAEMLFDQMRDGPAMAPLDICQRLLAIVEASCLTNELAADYFSNLEILLGAMPRLEKPGQIVIGLGPGRCGSTSLSTMLGTVANSCCTHETPPPIYWTPQREQIAFHCKRLGMLADRYSLVSDVSHWWLNAIERVFEAFPEAKAVGLMRDPGECAASFMRIQGFGKGSFNPWATPDNGLWRAGQWDPTYPSYSPPSYAGRNPDRAKLELITRYVSEYNARVEAMASTAPDRVKLIRTDDLSKDAVQEEIFELANARGQKSAWRLNVKGIADGKINQIKL